eukprot:Nitzschia sp. Nitz4//scaffold102_size76354//1482//3183//NITZ4_005620-RA/size76354-snap-gene-0.131-mRNA-1//-1//CDS//3329532213//4507//frame0
MSSRFNGRTAKAFNMNRSGEETHEEQPELRAVALARAEPPLLHGSLDNDAPFGKAALVGLSRPELYSKRAASISVKQEWSEENWKVTQLEQVPADFPLERTHREIRGVTASEVASRISDALRRLSVCAEYDSSSAKAKCTTTDSVSFRIRLYSGGDDGLPVVVEVQRRNGSPSSFMKVCRGILNAAEGAEVAAETVPSRKILPTFMKGPVGGMKCLAGVAAVQDVEAQLTNGLEKSLELLASGNKEANILGFENLCMLTDPLKTNPTVALKACKAILLEDRCSKIRHEVSVWLHKELFVASDETEDGVASLEDKGRHLSLVLLSNALALTGKDGCLAKAIKEQQWFVESLVPCLLGEVDKFQRKANHAYEAACGLTALATCSEHASQGLKDLLAVDRLKSAYQFGVHNHELLANECERALLALGESL